MNTLRHERGVTDQPQWGDTLETLSNSAGRNNGKVLMGAEVSPFSAGGGAHLIHAGAILLDSDKHDKSVIVSF